MSGLETRLRELLELAAGEPPRSVSVSQVRRRVRRRKTLRGAAAISAAATVLLIAVAAMVIPGALQSGSQHRGVAGAIGGPTAYVASADAVVAINLRTNTVLKTIKVPGIPQSMAITPNGRTVYVVSLPITKQGNPPPARVGGYVTPISTATDRAGRPIWLRGDPEQILITPSGRTAYVIGDSGLVPIDLRTRQVLPAIKVRVAFEMAMTPNGKTIYLGAGDTGKGHEGPTDEIVPIDLSTGKALRPIFASKAGGPMFGPVVTPNGATLYVAAGLPVSGKPGRVTWAVLPISTVTNRALKPITERNFSGLQLAFGTGGATLYTASSNSVLPIETATNKPLKQIRLPDTGDSYSLASSPDGSTVYAADQNATGSKSWVVPITAATNTAGTPISLGPGWGPFIMAVAPDGSIYVGRQRGSPHGMAGTVTVVRPGSGTISKVIRIDGGPIEIVFAP